MPLKSKVNCRLLPTLLPYNTVGSSGSNTKEILQEMFEYLNSIKQDPSLRMGLKIMNRIILPVLPLLYIRQQ